MCPPQNPWTLSALSLSQEYGSVGRILNGEDTHPIFAFLKAGAPGVLGTEGIKWNFTKFLVDREGRVVARYASAHKPEDIAADIERLL